MNKKAILLILIACLFLALCFPAFCETAPANGNSSASAQSGKGVPYIFYLLAVFASSYYFYRKRKDREKAIQQNRIETPDQTPTDQKETPHEDHPNNSTDSTDPKDDGNP